ncbi:hypothetical protein OJAV_G00136350 [Oryzias javanicus]|uniref:ribonuclease H n=1 Tax=Oryzias javanicus TaxID=123683 RepID=A0A3S2MNL7_ORYJA|nr:hypothetical protein OJAV_G00136350 [Oryzias javanicus]
MVLDSCPLPRMDDYMDNIELQCYLDDLVIYTVTWEDHIETLREVFSHLAAATLTLNLAKCVLGQTTVTYLEDKWDGDKFVL